MFCLPGGTTTLQTGRMIRLRAGGGGNDAWAPGNFGFLDVTSMVDPSGPCASETSTAGLTRCLIGANGTVTQCLSIRGVSTSPGQQVGLADDGLQLPLRHLSERCDDREGEGAKGCEVCTGAEHDSWAGSHAWEREPGRLVRGRQ
jgi:hypothetical protein